MTGCIEEGKARLTGLTRRFIADDHGVISVMAAFSLVLVLGIAAIVVDAGALLLTRRSLQNATDAAALSAVQHLPDGTDAAVDDVLTENHYNLAQVTKQIAPGSYSTTEAVHFQQGASEPNAVRVTLTTNAPTYFAKALGLGNFTTVHTTAVAAIVPTITFGAGTQLAEINTAAINTVLSGLLGADVDIADYSTLVNAHVDALSFLETLATSVGLTIGSSTYEQLLQTEVSIPQILDAAATELLSEDSHSIAASLLQTIAGKSSPGRTFPLSNILDASYLADKTIGQGRKGANISAMDLVEAAIGSGSTGQSIDVGLNIPNLTQAKLAIGAPMKFAVGPVGTEIHTAQIRLKLTASLSVLGTGLLLPIYIEAAEGTAKVIQIGCQPDNVAVLAGTSGAVTARFASISNAALVDFSAAPTTSPATVDILGHSAVSVSASATVLGIGPVEKTFDHLGQTEQISATDAEANLISNLGSSVSVSPNIPLVSSVISGAASGAVNTLGTALIPVLQALGVRLGNLDMTVTGSKCAPVLVE